MSLTSKELQIQINLPCLKTKTSLLYIGSWYEVWKIDIKEDSIIKVKIQERFIKSLGGWGGEELLYKHNLKFFA